MRKCLITCKASPGEPAWYALWQLARERFMDYADVHGYDYREFFYDDFDEKLWPGVIHGRLPVWPFSPDMSSPCWQKIPAIADSLERYDLVVYLDNDCVILDFERDIANELPPLKWIGMAEGQTNEGKGPNVGVVVTRSFPLARQFWREAWTTDAWKTAKWTDQGSIMSLLGFSTSPPIEKLRDTPYCTGYHVLGSEWNNWTCMGVAPPGTRIYHAAWGRSGEWKLEVMRKAIEKHG